MQHVTGSNERRWYREHFWVCSRHFGPVLAFYGPGKRPYCSSGMPKLGLLSDFEACAAGESSAQQALRLVQHLRSRCTACAAGANLASLRARCTACAAGANLASLRACISELASESPAGVYNQVSSPVGASGLHSERSSAARVLVRAYKSKRRRRRCEQITRRGLL